MTVSEGNVGAQIPRQRARPDEYAAIARQCKVASSAISFAVSNRATFLSATAGYFQQRRSPSSPIEMLPPSASDNVENVEMVGRPIEPAGCSATPRWAYWRAGKSPSVVLRGAAVVGQQRVRTTKYRRARKCRDFTAGACASCVLNGSLHRSLLHWGCTPCALLPSSARSGRWRFAH